MDYLRYLLLWLCRMGYSRGFGIHSPTVYAFVRYVVNEHWPYYAYEDLKEKLHGANRTVRSLCRLLFRISNHLQPKDSLIIDPVHLAMKDYILAGCKHTNVLEWSGSMLQEALKPGAADVSNKTFDLVVCSAHLCNRQLREAIFRHTHSLSILVVIGIHANRQNREYWNRLIEDERSAVTLDLYSCGILFFDQTKSKQNYLINF